MPALWGLQHDALTSYKDAYSERDSDGRREAPKRNWVKGTLNISSGIMTPRFWPWCSVATTWRSMMRRSGVNAYYFLRKSLSAGQKLYAILVKTRSGEGSVRVAGDAMDGSSEIVVTNLGLHEEYYLIVLQPGIHVLLQEARLIGSSHIKNLRSYWDLVHPKKAVTRGACLNWYE